MKSKKEANDIVARVLHDIRKEKGFSKSRMSGELGIDERTYSRYESGESSPSLSEFITMIGEINVQVLPIVLRYLYPETYGNLSPASETMELRKSVCEFIMRDASDTGVRQLAYFLHGPHGSTLEAQLQLLCALDHLQMDVRLVIAKLVLNAWEIESVRGGLINKEYVQPDIEILRQAIIKAQMAVIEGRNSYSTAIK